MWSYVTAIWLIVPPMALNLAFAGRLPPAFQPTVFWAEIPRWIAVPENGFRVIAFLLLAFLPITGNRAGWVLYLGGLAAYGAAWSALIAAPDSGWAMSYLGFAAPALTPILWMLGLGLIGRNPAFDYWAASLVQPAYLLCAALFLLAHNAHAALVWSRLN